jgi:hypothetical protein
VRHQTRDCATDFKVVHNGIFWSQKNEDETDWQGNFSHIAEHPPCGQPHKGADWALKEVNSANKDDGGLCVLQDPLEDDVLLLFAVGLQQGVD